MDPHLKSESPAQLEPSGPSSQTELPEDQSSEVATESQPLSEVDEQAKDLIVETDKVSGRLPKPEMVDEKSKWLWEYIIPVVVFHLLIPVALFSYFTWWGVLFLFVGNYFFTSMGIGAGYHRLLTHRGFQCPKWFEYILTTLGVCSFQDSPARWVMVHRVHHQHSDHRPDPHTPKVSAFWSHMGWLFIENRALNSMSAYDRYVRDIMKDRYYMWLQRRFNWVWVYVAHSLLITALGFGVGFAVTGDLSSAVRWSTYWFMWGVIMRTVFTWHVTWGINSFAHFWGYRNYKTKEDSRNNWLFALLTNGEGWHNNHHADPRSARHGHRWWEVDVTYLSLIFLEKIGLIKGLVRPNYKVLDRKTV